jgi:hypothetical protein
MMCTATGTFVVIFLMPRPPGLPAGFLVISGFLAPSAGRAAGRGFGAAAVLAPAHNQGSWQHVGTGSARYVSVQRDACAPDLRWGCRKKHLLLPGRLRCQTRWELEQRSLRQMGPYAAPHSMMQWRLLCRSCQPPPAHSTCYSYAQLSPMLYAQQQATRQPLQAAKTAEGAEAAGIGVSYGPQHATPWPPGGRCPPWRPAQRWARTAALPGWRSLAAGPCPVSPEVNETTKDR